MPEENPARCCTSCGPSRTSPRWPRARDISLAVAREAGARSGLMAEGLALPQVRYLVFLAKSPTGKAALTSLAATLMEDPKDVQFEFEPYLIHKGFVTVGQGGRQLTEAGIEYLRRLRRT
jgi:Holliday junction resolvasome RuvABC ATP-dependent DNA helicase subunit